MKDALTKTEQVQLLVESYLEKMSASAHCTEDRKSELIREANEDMDKALKIARKFKHWDRKSQKGKVELASEIKEYKDFYVQLGKDIEKEYQAGVDVMVSVFGALDSVEV